MAAKRLHKSGKGSIRVPSGATLIYTELEEIRATKGSNSNWPRAPFKHKSTNKKTKVYGLPNGQLLITAPYPLWDIFDYPDKR